MSYSRVYRIASYRYSNVNIELIESTKFSSINKIILDILAIVFIVEVRVRR